MEILVNADWKGNVMELQHICRAYVVTYGSIVIDINQLTKSLFGINDTNDRYGLEHDSSFDEKIEAYEGYLIRTAY